MWNSLLANSFIHQGILSPTKTWNSTEKTWRFNYYAVAFFILCCSLLKAFFRRLQHSSWNVTVFFSVQFQTFVGLRTPWCIKQTFTSNHTLVDEHTSWCHYNGHSICTSMHRTLVAYWLVMPTGPIRSAHGRVIWETQPPSQWYREAERHCWSNAACSALLGASEQRQEEKWKLWSHSHSKTLGWCKPKDTGVCSQVKSLAGTVYWADLSRRADNPCMGIVK